MKFVAVTSCPTGIAHTYMAAEALEQAAADSGDEMHVETQGSAGSDPLDPQIIADADAVIFAADVESAIASVLRANRSCSRASSGPSAARPRC
jgi:PTS system fructose-specific IIC component